ncbi:DUF6986 family protein [Streptomyces sp. YIM 98790]|uniref:DUF6986 family protein n=1 Tax=Streptomyces sp. YIM 98790 TaxID=2689077 RepID=UPI00140C641A|nr:aldolase/citrate lyase family protein [Streptomyces sp. YIM 98790]
MGQREPIATSLAASVRQDVAAMLADTDALLAARYPGDRGGRQPVHTVYVPAGDAGPGTVADWGRRALALLDEHAPGPAALASALDLDPRLAADVYPRLRAKLSAEPVEDLRIDFEDGYGRRPDADEDADAARAARLVARACADGTAPPYLGIRPKSLEAGVRDRAIRTLDIFLTGVLEAAGGLPEGLRLTLPKVSHQDQAAAMARICAAFERARGLPDGRLGFEIQIETAPAVLGPDGAATVARMIGAAGGRVTGLHYGTFDYSAGLGIAAAHQAPDHPAADHAKAVMQTAAAGTGVRLSDGSTNVLPSGSPAQVRAAWRLHYGLVRRALVRGYHQGWDMHPGHLPTRYAAGYAFYREGLPPAAARLAAWAGGRSAGRGGGNGGDGGDVRDGGDGGQAVLDEPATVRALAGFLLRGLDCGALDPEETTRLSGLSSHDLRSLTLRH